MENKTSSYYSHKKAGLKKLIKDKFAKGLDYNNLAEKLQALIQEMVNNGMQIDVEAEKAFLKNPDTSIKVRGPVINANKRKKPKKKKTAGKNTKQVKKSYYILNLAWTEKNTGIVDTAKTISNFLDSMDIKQISSESNQTEFGTEKILQYEFTGTEAEYNILTKAASIMIATLSKTDYEQFNIVIYGKKLTE